MSIRPLPAPSIRALGSGQALTDPPALIKELLDNSLDAHATQISVEVSANTLDILQVKDNGHGIPLEDRDAMALRHHTSKIRDFGDIQDCRTLGFRGEALASAAELAGGGLTITTRVEGEKVAVACNVDRSGVVVGRRPVGAAVGTTVRAEGFLKSLPVRRENALRNAQKSIARLRALLQRYYISHPRCRFSLRILASGTKGRSEDIVYAPSKTVPEAVQKAVGKDVTAACEWIDTSSSLQNKDSDMNIDGEEQPIVLEAFLPKSTASPAVIAKKPQCTNFVFVDFRTVSCARGTLKQILALYKSYLKSALDAQGVSDPFIYLNIRCPPGSYDPNIEPAKDDVMFYNAEAVVTAVEKMLKGFYGEIKIDDNTSNIKGKAKEAPRNSFEVLLARKPKPAPAPVGMSAKTSARKSSSSSRRPNVRPVEEPEYDEDEEELAAREMDAVMSSGFVDINLPLGGRVFPPVAGAEKDQDHPMGGTEDVEEVAGPSNEAAPVNEAIPLTTGVATTSPVTPRRKSTNWGFNMYGGADPEDDGDEEEFAPMEPNASDNEESARRDITISNPWTTAKINAPINHSSSPVRSSPLPQRPVRKPFKPPLTVTPENRRSSRNRADAPITPIASSPGAPREESARKTNKGSDGNTGLMSSRVSGSRRRGGGEAGEESPPAARKGGFISAAKFYQDRPNDENDDSDEAQYHRRPKPAPKRRRLNDSPDPEADHAAPVSPPKPSPHKNRFLAATAALHSPAQQTTLTGGPPVLLPPPAQRTKSRHRTRTLLPLESVPELAMQTHMLSRPVEIKGLKGMFAALRACDGYVGGSAAGMGGAEGVDDGLFCSECAEWEDASILGEVMEAWLKRVNVDFEGAGWEMVGSIGEGTRVLRVVDDNQGGVE